MTSFPQRKSPRLQGYDYSQSGAYFVTLCTHQRRQLFGEVVNQTVRLTAAGMLAQECWFTIPDHYPDVELDAFVVMPNHVHGILVLVGDNTHFNTILGRVINAYKGAVTARVRRQRAAEVVLWQSRYHDRIIRTAAELDQIRAYVEANPARWMEDTFFPES